METTPWVMRSSKISFSIGWKGAGLFVSPKYITSGSNKPRLSSKSRFTFIAFFYPHIVIPPTDIELGEVLCAFESVDEVVDEGEGIVILSGDQLERAIV